MDNITRTGKSGRRLLVFILVLEVVSVCVLLPGCSPKVKTEYVYRDVHHRDTTIQHDSVYIREWIKGDTVHHYEYRDRYIYRDRWRDSIQIREVHDTTTVEKKVEKELSAVQKAKINSFWWMLVGLILSLGWIFRKPILAILKRLI